MPIYEYRCEDCGGQFEVIQKFSDQPLTTHDACGGNVHRLLSAPAFKFKGSGWYVNDYAKGSKSDGSKGSKSDSGDSSKTESSSSKGESSSSNTSSSDSSSSGSKSTSTPASDSK